MRQGRNVGFVGASLLAKQSCFWAPGKLFASKLAPTALCHIMVDASIASAKNDKKLFAFAGHQGQGSPSQAIDRNQPFDFREKTMKDLL